MTYNGKRVIRAVGKIEENIQTMGILYEDGQVETIIYETEKSPASSWQVVLPFRTRRNLRA